MPFYCSFPHQSLLSYMLAILFTATNLSSYNNTSKSDCKLQSNIVSGYYQNATEKKTCCFYDINKGCNIGQHGQQICYEVLVSMELLIHQQLQSPMGYNSMYLSNIWRLVYTTTIISLYLYCHILFIIFHHQLATYIAILANLSKFTRYLYLLFLYLNILYLPSLSILQY